MKDIDFISAVVDELMPQWPEIERSFEEENDRFKRLLEKKHDIIGHVLKHHLIIETYLNHYLKNGLDVAAGKIEKLRFVDKVNRLPTDDVKIRFITPGIREINEIRNRYGHALDATVTAGDLHNCLQVLAAARRGRVYETPQNIIEDFTTVACTWLIVNKDLEKIFNEAFRKCTAL